MKRSCMDAKFMYASADVFLALDYNVTNDDLQK